MSRATWLSCQFRMQGPFLDRTHSSDNCQTIQGPRRIECPLWPHPAFGDRPWYSLACASPQVEVLQLCLYPISETLKLAWRPWRVTQFFVSTFQNRRFISSTTYSPSLPKLDALWHSSTRELQSKLSRIAARASSPQREV